MNKPDKAGEPSMEEILASIRQIIADEPAAEQTEPSTASNPLVPQSYTAARQETPQPLSDRLSNVLKSGPLPPTSPFGSKRPFSFDQDLADMFDEGDSGPAPAAPKPDRSLPTGLSHPMVRKSFVPHPAARQEAAKPFSDGAAALPPHFASSEPVSPPPPFGTAEKPASPAAAPSPAPATSGFPPLRKPSFFPPQSTAPSAPTPGVRIDDPTVSKGAIPAEPSTSDAAKAPLAAASLEEALRAARASAAIPAAADAKPASTVETGPVLRSAPIGDVPFTDPPLGTAGSSAGAAETKPSPASATGGFGAASPFAAFAPSPATTAAASASPAAPATPPRPEAPVEPKSTAASPAFGASEAFGSTEKPVDDPVVRQPPLQQAPTQEPSRPAEPRSFAGPITGTPPASPGYASQPRFAGGADTGSSAAAHNALDALALGLAASAAASSAMSPETQSPAVPLTPIVEPAPAPHSAPQPSMLPATVQSYGGHAPPRTLEDAVADMLRPMLQQWVAENMPRIIERALRTEVANTMKPGQKPPGT